MSVTTKLTPHEYRYFPYEKKLAIREAINAAGSNDFKDVDGILQFETEKHPKTETLQNLVYFKYFDSGHGQQSTKQCIYESLSGGTKRQSTRYGPHGLHEYKGKFNPQLVRGLLNAFSESTQGVVLDPFCGSGTSLVEVAISGRKGIGFDMNPLAVYIANAKVLALKTPIRTLTKVWNNIKNDILLKADIAFTRSRRQVDQAYLENWFRASILKEADGLQALIYEHGKNNAPVFLCVLSDLLRDYSEQEPADLRIRRRRTEYPTEDLSSAFIERMDKELCKLADFQDARRGGLADAHACLQSSALPVNKGALKKKLENISAIITSPPYATALPYIDTNRLSLVWLGLISAEEIKLLEAKITGSREFRKQERREWAAALDSNSKSLPSEICDFCNYLESSLQESDGFRKRALPSLLYRYFSLMKDMFFEMANLANSGTPFILVVGVNSTNVGGHKTIIDTPNLLVPVANAMGWDTDEIVDMETYKRYEIHRKNSVSKERILVFRKS